MIATTLFEAAGAAKGLNSGQIAGTVVTVTIAVITLVVVIVTTGYFVHHFRRKRYTHDYSNMLAIIHKLHVCTSFFFPYKT